MHKILISKEKYFFIVVHPQLALSLDFLFEILYVWGPSQARLTRNDYNLKYIYVPACFGLHH